MDKKYIKDVSLLKVVKKQRAILNILNDNGNGYTFGGMLIIFSKLFTQTIIGNDFLSLNEALKEFEKMCKWCEKTMTDLKKQNPDDITGSYGFDNEEEKNKFLKENDDRIKEGKEIMDDYEKELEEKENKPNVIFNCTDKAQ